MGEDNNLTQQEFLEQFYRQGEFTHDSSNPFLNFVSSVLNRAIIDATFVDEYNSGVYSKIISPNEIQEAYECRTYGLINGYKVSIRKELKDTFFVGIGDRKIADILGLNEKSNPPAMLGRME